MLEWQLLAFVTGDPQPTHKHRWLMHHTYHSASRQTLGSGTSLHIEITKCSLLGANCMQFYVQVSEYDGPPPSSPVATAESSPASASSSSSSSSTSSSSSSSSPSSSSSSGGCADVTPGAYTCSQEQSWGHCKQSWMTKVSSTAPNGYCAQTCGRC